MRWELMGPESRIAIPDLARALRAKHEYIRRAAGWTLWKIDPRPDITAEEVNRLINQFEAEHQEKMRVERAGERTPDEVRVLIEALGSDDSKTRIQAIRDLGRLGSGGP